ncbi:MAG: hypothetical protein K1X92_15475 [Bacteroidia bacterium]|nr:hypothetical protein [Bacteroidia bacterium]
MKNKQVKIIIILGLLTGLVSGCYYDNVEFLYPNQNSCDTTNVTYNGKIAPLLQTNCNGCHSQSSASGNVVLEGYSNVKAQVTNGKLYGSISYAQGVSPMPKNGTKLSDCDISNVKRWIDAGAPEN